MYVIPFGTLQRIQIDVLCTAFKYRTLYTKVQKNIDICTALNIIMYTVHQGVECTAYTYMYTNFFVAKQHTIFMSKTDFFVGFMSI